MRIVVTGASGNIGTALLRRLTREPGHELTGVCRRIPDVPPMAAPVTWVPVDLATTESLGVLERAFEGADVVVHLAWGFQPTHQSGYLAELGIGGTRRVLHATSNAGVGHLVHMSSVGAYSPKRDDKPVDESWPTDGIATSAYSMHKATAERLLDRHLEQHPDLVVTRFRPGIVGQRTAGSALLRYGLPALVPAWLLGHLPVVPLDLGLTIPMVHADDVADAIVLELNRRLGGAFNLAADPPVTTQLIADTLDARAVHVPFAFMRPVMSGAWHLRLQPVDVGWLDMALAVPSLDTTRARQELGWSPQHDAATVLAEVLAGMREREDGRTPVLRSRSVMSAVGDLVRRGPVGKRRQT